MEDAASLFGLAAMLFGLGFVVRVSVASWLQLKRFEREGRQPPAAPDRDAAALAARLARVEQVVEVTAMEVERVAEGQRYAVRLLAEQRAAAPGSVPQRPAQVITPH